jgi:hypothetical protein
MIGLQIQQLLKHMESFQLIMINLLVILSLIQIMLIVKLNSVNYMKTVVTEIF